MHASDPRVHAAAEAHPHSFVVPAYGQSPYLRACLASLSEQTDPSPIVVTTSTPYEGLHALTQEFGARLVEHSPNLGIGRDWNFALSQAVTDWVTIAHQDDLYAPRFKEATLDAISGARDAILVTTGYQELVEGVRPSGGYLPALKSALLEFGFLGRNRIRSRWSKTNCLRFGNAIPCPTVTLHSRAGVRFDEELRVNLDWSAWLDLCALAGSFIRVREPLVVHRIHAASETSNTMDSGHRRAEDEQLLRRLWPRWFAQTIARTYGLAYASNKT